MKKMIKMKKQIKITILLITLLSFLITQVVSHDVFNFIENSDKKIVVLKTNKNLSKTNTILAKKRIKIYDDALCSVFLFYFYPQIDSTLTSNIKLGFIPQTTKYSVWSRATFS
jgi:hypothetical protein